MDGKLFLKKILKYLICKLCFLIFFFSFYYSHHQVQNSDNIVEEDGMDDIYFKLILPQMENPGQSKDSLYLFALFQRLFDSINIKLGMMKDGRRPTTMELKGMESLWIFLACETSENSLKLCINKLISLVLNLHPSAYNGDKKIAWNIFMEKCMSLMMTTTAEEGNKSNRNIFLSGELGDSERITPRNSLDSFSNSNKDATLQSVLELVSTFLNKVKQQKLPYNLSNPGMLLGARMNVEWSTKGGGFKRYMCTVDNFNGHNGRHHVTYVDDDTKWYQILPGSAAPAGGQDCDVYLKNDTPGGKRGWIVKWDPKRVKRMSEKFNDLKRYPFHILSHDTSYFNTLFTMIGRKNENTVKAAWSLLMKEGVPTNPEKKTKLALCGASETDLERALSISRKDSERGDNTLRQGSSSQNPLRQRTNTISEIDGISKEEWNLLLGGSKASPLQLLYGLQIVNELVFPENDTGLEPSQTQKSQAKKYAMRFVRSGGFTHLYHLLTSGNVEKFGDDNLSKKACVYLLRLFNHFYNLIAKDNDNNDELMSIVNKQMNDYSMDTEYGDLIPRLLQIISIISRAVTVRSSSSSSKYDDTIIIQPSATGNSKNQDNTTAATNAKVVSIEAETIENATGLLVSCVTKQPNLINIVYNNDFTSDAFLFALIECPDSDVRSELGRGINKLCMGNSNDSKPNVHFLQLLMNKGLKNIMNNRKLRNKSQEFFVLVDTLIKESTSLQGIEISDIAKTLSDSIQSSPIVQRTENDNDFTLNGLITCLTSLLAKDGSEIGK
jgi:hypothetical protein